jgi:hypothetical protein
MRPCISGPRLTLEADRFEVSSILKFQPAPPTAASALGAGGSPAGFCPHTNATHQFVIESRMSEYSRAAAEFVFPVGQRGTRSESFSSRGIELQSRTWTFTERRRQFGFLSMAL